MDYLLFRLYGPMASWGEVAVGETRNSSTYPSKSAVVGLLAAALGIRREEDTLHQQLTEGYKQGVKVLSTGGTLKDYHTAQAPDSVGKFRYRTRRDEIVLGKERLGTVLSSREYRTDAHAIVALRPEVSAPWSLVELQQALIKPKFHLYLGRKSCPLAAPLQPKIVSTDNFYQALEAYTPASLLPEDKREWMTDKRWLRRDSLLRYYWEGTLEDFCSDSSVVDPQQVYKLARYDKPLSRVRWQFQPRTEYFWQIEEAS